MIQIVGVGTVVVLLVAVLVLGLVVGLFIQAVWDVQVAKHTGQPPRARDEHREPTAWSGRALTGRPLTEAELTSGKEAGGRLLSRDELRHGRLAS